MKIRRIEAENIAKFVRILWDLSPDTDTVPPDRILIFGWNATGKTTVSRLLDNSNIVWHYLSGGQSDRRAASADATKGSAAENIRIFDENNRMIPCDTIKTAVFNADFVRKTVYSSNRFIYIGPHMVQRRAALGRIERYVAVTLLDRKKKLEDDVKRQKSDIRDKMHAVFANIKNLFGHEFNQPRSWTVSDVEKVWDEVRTMAQEPPDPRSSFGDFDQIKDNRPLLDDDTRATIENLRGHLRRLAELIPADLAFPAVGSQLPHLDDPEVADWLREGLPLHDRHSPDTCLFCQQRLPEHWRASIQRRLSEAEQPSALGSLRACLRDSLAAIDRVLASRSLLSAFAGALDRLSRLQGMLDAFRAALDSHDKRRMPPLETVRRIVSDILHEISHFFEREAKSQSNLKQKRKEYAKQLARHLVWQQKNDLDDLQSKLDTAKEKLKKIERRYALAKKVLQRRQGQLDRMSKIASSMTCTLKNVLAERGIEIRWDAGEKAFVISRGGRDIQHPSEGERNVIALAVWIELMKQISEQDDGKNPQIIVIDDPVTSLDRQHMYSLIALLRRFVSENFKESQMIVMTHDEDCYNWLKGEFEPKAKHDKLKRLRMFLEVSRDEDGYVSKTVYEPFWLRCESVYEYLYAYALEVRDGNFSAEHVVSHNHLRRLLETFLSFHWPPKPFKKPWDHWRQKLFERKIIGGNKNVLLTQILHEESHTAEITGGLGGAAYASAKQLAQEVLEVIRSLAPEHAKAMNERIAELRSQQG